MSSTYYQVPYSRSPIALNFNGAPLTQYPDRASANAAGRGWVDETASAGDLYLVLNGGDTPWSGTVEAIQKFYLSTDPNGRIFNGIYYDGRITSLPNISQRFEDNFQGITQIGSASLKLNNQDGYFNAFRSLIWANGATVVKMGVDVRQSDGTIDAQAYSDYQTIGSWLNVKHTADAKEFTLDLSENKERLRRSVPLNFVDLTTYPNAYQTALGKPVPLAYGKIYSATPLIIDYGSRIFKVADHAVYSIDDVRYKDATTNAWKSITPVSKNFANATFTLDSTWNGKDPIAVDFQGKKNADGSLMSNPADIVRDILKTIGETTATYNDASFNTAGALFQYGTNPTAVSMAPFLYIDRVEEALNVINKINSFANTYLYTDANGLLNMLAFRPQPGESLDVLTDLEIKDLSDEYDESSVYDSIIVTYGARQAEQWQQSFTLTNPLVKYAQGLSGDRILAVSIPSMVDADAQVFAYRTLEQQSTALRKLTIGIPWLGTLYIPGTQLLIQYFDNGYSINQVFEVLEQSVNVDASEVTLVLGDLHGIQTCGFWRTTGDALPTRFSTLAGYGTGSLVWNTGWDPLIKAWAKQNVAYWTDANGFADPNDSDSYISGKWF